MSQGLGKPVDRVDGRLKVMGSERYSADIPVVNIAHAVLVGSTIPKGRVINIDMHAALSAPGMLRVFTHRDMPKFGRVEKFSAGPAGKIGTTGVVAAVANGIFHATGKRVRDLLITLDKLLWEEERQS